MYIYSRKLISDRNADVKLSVPPAPYLELNTPDKDGTNKPSILVMEDMSIENFRDPYNKKSNGLGLEYAKLTVMELAKLHACGYAYIKSYPGWYFLNMCSLYPRFHR